MLKSLMRMKVYTTYDVHGPEKIVERIAKSVNFVEEGDTK